MTCVAQQQSTLRACQQDSCTPTCDAGRSRSHGASPDHGSCESAAAWIETRDSAAALRASGSVDPHQANLKLSLSLDEQVSPAASIRSLRRVLRPQPLNLRGGFAEAVDDGL